MTPPVYLNFYFLLAMVLVQKLGQHRQSRIHFLFTGAGPLVEIDAAARADALAVLRTEGLRVHLQDEYRPGQIPEVYRPILQEEDIVAVLVLQLLRQHGFVPDRFVLVKSLEAAVAHGLEDGARFKGQQKHPRDIPHIAGNHNRTLYGTSAAEVHIGKVQFKLEIYPLSGGVDDLSNI